MKGKIDWTRAYLILSSIAIVFLILLYLGIISLGGETYKMDLTGIPECKYDELSQTAMCLTLYVNKIFIFRLSDNSQHLTLQELIELGGDCVDYSSFYITALKSYGYEAEPISTYDHIFVVAYSENEYCVIDMVSIHCRELT